MKKILLILLYILSTQALHAESIYSLDGVKEVYLVVDISGKDIPKIHKQQIMEQLKKTSNDLGLDSSGYHQRSFAAVISEKYIGNLKIVDFRLFIGEQVQREGIDTQHFAMTYIDSEQFILTNDLDLDEKIEDTMDTLLARFTEQYQDENTDNNNTLIISDQQFAIAMGYETDYSKALKRAKKEHKNIMLVLVANFCPWCRKFEQRVLLRKEVDQLIQKNYIPLIINRETGKFPKEFDKSLTPIVHFIDYKTSKSYAMTIGYNNREEFLYLLNKGI